MMLSIEDNLSFRAAWNKFRRDWVAYHMKDGMSIAELARRSRTTRKTIREIISTPVPVELWTTSACVYCGTMENIEEHHVDGKAHTDATIWLCEKCHAIFHNMNKRYKTPKEN